MVVGAVLDFAWWPCLLRPRVVSRCELVTRTQRQQRVTTLHGLIHQLMQDTDDVVAAAAVVARCSSYYWPTHSFTWSRCSSHYRCRHASTARAASNASFSFLTMMEICGHVYSIFIRQLDVRKRFEATNHNLHLPTLFILAKNIWNVKFEL